MQYELVRQQAQAAEGVPERTVNMVRGMMQDAAEIQARQMKDSMDAIRARMDTITSKTRFAKPEAAAQRLDDMLKTTAATLGQVQADQDRLSAQESSIIQRESAIGRREATINERDKRIEQRLASAANEAEQEKKMRELSDARVQRVQAAQDEVIRLQQETQAQRDRLNELMRRTNDEEGRTRIQVED
jgi:DNA repair exonuclease SbcCD ATPase subunit